MPKDDYLCSHSRMASRCAECAPTVSASNRPPLPPATPPQIGYLAQLICERGWHKEQGGELNKPGLKKDEALLLIKDMMPALSKVDASALIGELIVRPGLKRLAKEADKEGIARAGSCTKCHRSLTIAHGNAYIYETITWKRVADLACEKLGKCRCACCLVSVRVRVSCVYCRAEYFRVNGKVDVKGNLAVEHPVYGSLYSQELVAV